MKILSSLETILINLHFTYHLPHLAIELDVNNKEFLEDGQVLQFENHLFNLSAKVFKPGDGSRLILKDFKVQYISTLAPKWWQKLLSLILVKNIIYWTKPHKEVVQDISNFLESSGKRVLYLGKYQGPIFTENLVE